MEKIMERNYTKNREYVQNQRCIGMTLAKTENEKRSESIATNYVHQHLEILSSA